jgi:hypothetical protein
VIALGFSTGLDTGLTGALITGVTDLLRLLSLFSTSTFTGFAGSRRVLSAADDFSGSDFLVIVFAYLTAALASLFLTSVFLGSGVLDLGLDYG